MITKNVVKSSSFTVVHQNINRLKNKVSRLECELQLHKEIDVLCLSEHWLSHSQLDAINIMNYKLSAKFCRTTGRGGGVCIYSRSSLLTIERTDMEQLGAERALELCAAEYIGLGVIVICVYKPPRKNGEPDNFQEFKSRLTSVFQMPAFKHNKIIIVGDINVDSFKNSPENRSLSNLMKSAGMKSLVSFPTRICKTTQTCIDHAYSNLPLNLVLCVEPKDFLISDHLSIFVSVKIEKVLQCNAIIFKRLFSVNNINDFKLSIQNYDWHTTIFCNMSCPGKIFNNIFDIVFNFYKIHFPVKKCPMKSNSKTWINEQVIRARKRLHISKLNLVYNPSVTNYDNIKMSERVFVDELYNARKNYLNNSIATSNNISRTTWQLIASETGRCIKNNAAIDILVSKTDGRSDEHRAAAVATALNRFYVNVANSGTNAHSSISVSLTYLCKYVGRHQNVFRFDGFPTKQVLNIVSSLKRKDSKDINDMSTKVLDIMPHSFLTMIGYLFNRCVREGVYPSILKNVKVQPVFKGKGDVQSLKNYRPISLIPIFSKIFESLLSNNLMNYFYSNNLMNKQQYAYQSGRSTVDAVRDVVDRVLVHLEGGRRVAAIFCDLSRAFEMVSHPLLLAKLEHYGVNGSFLDTISSFLENRKQITCVKSCRSELMELGSYAVPQGSTMGNSLFLILMNDLTSASDDAEFVMFADDGCVIVAAETLDLLKLKLTKVMAQVSAWFSANGMALNVEKTNIMQFSLRGGMFVDLMIKCNGQYVPQVNNIKYLGVTIDAGLTWSPHIDALCNRLSSACFALTRLRPSLNHDNLKKAYYGYFHSLLTYGVEFWGNAAERDRAFKLQKRAIRIMSGMPWNYPARELFRQNKILTLASLYILNIAKHTHQNIDQFVRRADIHGFNTRRRNDLEMPTHRLVKSSHSLRIMGPKVYNRIESEIKDVPSYNLFVSKIKKKLALQALYTVNEYFDDAVH